RILDSFEERGFAITEWNQPADVYVINTCSVTQTAERKSRQMVRRLARQNPAAVVVMTGCYGEMAKIKGESVDEAALVVPEPEKLARQGYRELVVTGVLVGAYGPDSGSGGPDLAELLRSLAAAPGIERVRLSSIEPTQVTDSLLRAFAEEPKICNHLHIPLQ